MIKYFVYLTLFFTLWAQDDEEPVQEQATLDNDPEFLQKFQVQILKRGSLKQYPKENDELLVYYHGMNMEEKVFDSSFDRKQPFKYKFGSRGVIRCWNECFKRMTLGDKIRVVCPSKYAYGKHSVGPLIQPNSDLIMEFELLGINGETLPSEYIDDL